MANRLHQEKSLYLKQHEKNPVHWWPYSKEAFLEAKNKNLPIFISIGYSSCHWCHVMAHESFENEATAQILNQNYINIKIDREEFPDVDSYYQKACQAFGGNGGWPLSVFLTPESEPMFVGTYFPNEPRNGMPSFNQVSTDLSNAYKNKDQKFLENARKAKEIINQKPIMGQKVDFSGHFPPPAAVLNALKEYQDNRYGSYGAAPKFPHFSFFEWALEQMLEGTVNKEQGDFVIDSVEKMMMGGIFDQIRGGVHRYSTDEKWLVPHFEKMLYDQAGLLKMLTLASTVMPSPLFFDGIIQTLDYLENEMLHEEKYFMAAQDADSEGHEGLYFTFSKEEILDIIDQSEIEELIKNKDKLIQWINIGETANFEQGLNVISLNFDKKDEFYQKNGWTILRDLKQVLLESRRCRIPPATDNKGIASWNFQLITSLCTVIQFCRVDTIRQQAMNLLNISLEGVFKAFLKTNENGSTYIRNTTTKDETLSYFEDHVFFCEMNLRLYELSGNSANLNNAIQTTDFLINEFFKDGYFYTRSLRGNLSDSVPHPNLEVPTHDQAYRSPLATLIFVMKRLEVLTLKTDQLEKLKSLNEMIINSTLQHPLASSEALRAYTYPELAFRKIEVPKTWLNTEKFNKLLSMFPLRFVFSYHDNKNEDWQICNTKSCEANGKSIEDFEKTFLPSGNNAPKQ